MPARPAAAPACASICPYANTDTGWGGTSSNNTCGWAVDEADMNGDGINDIIIGVPGGSVTGSNQEGYVYVLYGKSSGWSSTYSLSTIY